MELGVGLISTFLKVIFDRLHDPCFLSSQSSNTPLKTDLLLTVQGGSGNNPEKQYFLGVLGFMYMTRVSLSGST